MKNLHFKVTNGFGMWESLKDRGEWIVVGLFALGIVVALWCAIPNTPI